MKTVLQQSVLWFVIGTAGGMVQAAEACAGPEPLLLKNRELNPAALAALREAGPAGVEALLAAAPAPGSPERAAWERALDTVCAQRDCAASGLYWHSDFDRALEEAARTGRPILSLRLLGRLDEEYSCANSRFFRTALYPDPRVARRLRERFVLHWESVRPAPRLTIDFGDGRTLEGTITGNSIHYILDARGRLVDALPGLYGPGMFLGVLTRAEAAARELSAVGDPDFVAALSRFHLERLRALDLALGDHGGFATLPPVSPAVDGWFGAREAAGRTISKRAVERPVLGAVARGSWYAGAAEPYDDGVDWSALAESRRAAWRLGPESREMLLRKHRPASAEDGERVIAGFERLVGLDTVRNEYLLHAFIHHRLAGWPHGAAIPDLAVFNERVYAELFLTPGSDPWLGLVSPDTYLALTPGG
jgi:hypothetical protein